MEAPDELLLNRTNYYVEQFSDRVKTTNSRLTNCFQKDRREVGFISTQLGEMQAGGGGERIVVVLRG